MSGTVLENLSGKKLSILVTILLLCLLVCFLIGSLVAPLPANSEGILSTVCLDDKPEELNLNRWFTLKCKSIDIHEKEVTGGLNASNFVFVFQMPLNGADFSRWQQHLVGMLQINFILKTGQELDKIIELTLDSRLAYRNKWDPEDKWTYYTHAQEKHIMDCTFDYPTRGDGYHNNSMTVPLFELGSLHHGYYLLNLRFPMDDKGMNENFGIIWDIYLNIIRMNGGFTKVWLSLKTVFFPINIAIMVWFWRRVRMLSRTPAFLEYLLICLGGTLAFLNVPLEFLTLYIDMPYMSLFSDIRQGVFYAMLFSFWLIFDGEQMLIKDSAEKNSIKHYWRYLSGIVVGFVIFYFCKSRVQHNNPFYLIWITPIGTNLALYFTMLVGILGGIYFTFLGYMLWKMFSNITLKKSILSSMSGARKLYYQGIIYRFHFLMLATLMCATVTIIACIMGQVAEVQNKWDENMHLEITSTFFIGVYGMWNIYVCAMLILCAPSHKQLPANPILEMQCTFNTGSK